MEDWILQKKKFKGKAHEFALELGFAEPDLFYEFIVNLGREDLIRFDGGKIILNTNMNPTDLEMFLKKYEKVLKTGRI